MCLCGWGLESACSIYVVFARLNPLSHGPLIQIRSGLNSNRIRISCVHTDRLIRIKMRVKLPSTVVSTPLIRIKWRRLVGPKCDSEVDALIDVWSNATGRYLDKHLCFCAAQKHKFLWTEWTERCGQSLSTTLCPPVTLLSHHTCTS